MFNINHYSREYYKKKCLFFLWIVTSKSQMNKSLPRRFICGMNAFANSSIHWRLTRTWLFLHCAAALLSFYSLLLRYLTCWKISLISCSGVVFTQTSAKKKTFFLVIDNMRVIGEAVYLVSYAIRSTFRVDIHCR